MASFLLPLDYWQYVLKCNHSSTLKIIIINSIGFAANHRRLRAGNDDVSVSSSTTPPVPRRVSPRIAAIENAQCNICMQQRASSEQRFVLIVGECYACRVVTILLCVHEMIFLLNALFAVKNLFRTLLIFLTKRLFNCVLALFAIYLSTLLAFANLI